FIIDRLLPDGSGLALLEQLRRAHTIVPAAMMSGTIDGDAVNAATEMGAFWMVKPLRTPLLERFATGTASVADCLATTAAAWAREYGLTDAEVDVLTRCALGESGEAIANA